MNHGCTSPRALAMTAYFPDFFPSCGLHVETRERSHWKNRTRIEAVKLQTLQHSFILFCQYYFIQVRSAALNILLWTM